MVILQWTRLLKYSGGDEVTNSIARITKYQSVVKRWTKWESWLQRVTIGNPFLLIPTAIRPCILLYPLHPCIWLCVHVYPLVYMYTPVLAVYMSRVPAHGPQCWLVQVIGADRFAWLVTLAPSFLGLVPRSDLVSPGRILGLRYIR